MTTRRAVRTACASLLLVMAGCWAAGCSSSSDTTADETPQAQTPGPSTLDYDVLAPGPFHVGFRSYKVKYQPKGPVPEREITVDVWYPTNDTEGDPAHYLITADLKSFDSAKPAPPVDPKGYPVRVHSHGYAAYGGSGAAMMRYFASHGWVTVAPDHAGNTIAQADAPIPLTHHLVRPQDISASLDLLEKLPADDPLSGKCRTEAVLMTGHSFGSRTTWAVSGATFDTSFIQADCDGGKDFSEPCTPEQIKAFGEVDLSDKRVVAGVPMAGGDKEGGSWFGPHGYDAAKKPMMLMSGGDDQVGADQVFAMASGLDITWLEIAGGCHELFNIGGCKNVPTEEGWTLVSQYLLAFGRRQVLGDKSDKVARILDNATPLSERVSYHHKAASGGGMP